MLLAFLDVRTMPFLPELMGWSGLIPKNAPGVSYVYLPAHMVSFTTMQAFNWLKNVPAVLIFWIERAGSGAQGALTTAVRKPYSLVKNLN